MPPVPTTAIAGALEEWIHAASEISHLIAFVATIYASTTYWSQQYHTSQLSVSVRTMQNCFPLRDEKCLSQALFSVLAQGLSSPLLGSLTLNVIGST